MLDSPSIATYNTSLINRNSGYIEAVCSLHSPSVKMSGGHAVGQSEAFAVSRQPMRGLCNCAKLCLSYLEVIGAKEGESVRNREDAICNIE